MGSEEWISVLKLSTMWTFGELRQGAITQLGRLNINPVDKVMLARDYRVESLLKQGYKELVKRKEGPSLEEAKVLGYEAAIHLYKKRERHHRESAPASIQMRQRANISLDTDIEKTFKEELDDIKRDSKAIEEASKTNVHGMDNDQPDQPSGATALISDSDLDDDFRDPSASSSRKRARMLV
jgi:hypothetical protein